MTSLWLDGYEQIPTDPLEVGGRYDVAVVGAGLTGLTTALLLARAGKSVVVIEARSVGVVATGNSTAKLSLLHGGALAGIHQHTSSEVLKAYVVGNRAGQAWLLKYLREREVDVQFRDAFSYAVTEDGASSVAQEFEACRAAELDVEEAHDIGLPFATTAAIRLADQAQFNPMDVLSALAHDVHAAGGTIIQGARVTDVKVAEPTTVETTLGDVLATQVILATGVPILDRGLYFAKVEPKRSYALAFRVPGSELPQGMYLSLDSASRSVRTARMFDDEYLIVGGNGHTVGRDSDTRGNVDDLDAWAKQHFPGAERTHSWSAQDYESANRIPFVGWMPRTGKKVFLATGYNKWGMTNGVAAALSLAADLLGEKLPWAEKLHHRVTRPASVASGAAMNAGVGGALAAGWAAAETHPLPDEPPAEGEGVVGSRHLKPVAESTVDGVVCAVSAICTHLGGVVTWNSAERSWDCPLHGSRFDAQGRVLEGPATSDLAPAKEGDVDSASR